MKGTQCTQLCTFIVITAMCKRNELVRELFKWCDVQNFKVNCVWLIKALLHHQAAWSQNLLSIRVVCLHARYHTGMHMLLQCHTAKLIIHSVHMQCFIQSHSFWDNQVGDLMADAIEMGKAYKVHGRVSKSWGGEERFELRGNPRASHPLYEMLRDMHPYSNQVLSPPPPPT